MKLSIIIPVFNEEKTIEVLYSKVAAVSMPGIKKEIIIIDDGSTDKTRSVLKKLKQIHKEIIFITHDSNKGKGFAIQSGIKKASGDYCIIQDADLEYNPQEIPSLMAPIISGRSTVVYGTRLKRLPNFKRDERTVLFFMHYLGNRMLSFLTSILYGHWITDMETCYKVIPTKVIKNMQLSASRFDFEPEITAKLLKNGYKIYEIPIVTNPRGYTEGKKLHAVRDGIQAFWTLLRYRFID